MSITELKALADDLVPLWDNGSFEREDAEQARNAINELIAQLEDARAQMERQKEEWLSWEAKRRDLEKAAAELIALKKAIGDAEPVASVALTSNGVSLVRRGDEKSFGQPLYTLKGIK